jgi:hypothetical protein
MNKIINTALVAVCLLSSSAFAELPSWYPVVFDSYGIIDSIKANTISIDGSRFILSPTAKVATTSNKASHIREIKSGQTVGANIITINSRKLVDHIWLIPKGEIIKVP